MKVRKRNCKAPTKLVLRNIRAVGVVNRKSSYKKKKFKKSRNNKSTRNKSRSKRKRRNKRSRK